MSSCNRKSHSGPMMRTQMTTSVMTKSYSPQLMKWILLFFLWIQWKVCWYCRLKHVKGFIYQHLSLLLLLSDIICIRNKFVCSDAIIRSNEVSEPDSDTWVLLSSSCKWCCPACWDEKRWDWEGKVGEVSSYHRFLSFWMYIVGSCFAVMFSSFCPCTHSL